MTLRRGRLYDRLRIAARDGGGPFGPALAAAQREGKIATAVADEMIADYASLCDAIAGMKAEVSAEDWLEIVYEDFAVEPRAGLARILAFLGLAAPPGYLDACAAIVREGGSRSRDRLEWRPDQRQAVADLIARHDFLSSHAGDA